MEFVTKPMCEPPDPLPTDGQERLVGTSSCSGLWYTCCIWGTLSNCGNFGGFCFCDLAGGKGSSGFLEEQAGKEVEGPLQSVVVLGPEEKLHHRNGGCNQRSQEHPHFRRPTEVSGAGKWRGTHGQGTG